MMIFPKWNRRNGIDYVKVGRASAEVWYDDLTGWRWTVFIDDETVSAGAGYAALDCRAKAADSIEVQLQWR